MGGLQAFEGLRIRQSDNGSGDRRETGITDKRGAPIFDAVRDLFIESLAGMQLVLLKILRGGIARMEQDKKSLS